MRRRIRFSVPAHVARPGISLHQIERFLIKTLGAEAFLLRLLMKTTIRMFGATAARRQAQRHDVEAVADPRGRGPGLIARFRSLLVAATMRTSVRISAAADGGVFALLQHACSRRVWRIHQHVADLVEEQRAALGLLEAAAERVCAPVKAPLAWPNSSISIRSARGSRPC